MAKRIAAKDLGAIDRLERYEKENALELKRVERDLDLKYLANGGGSITVSYFGEKWEIVWKAWSSDSFRFYGTGWTVREARAMYLANAGLEGSAPGPFDKMSKATVVRWLRRKGFSATEAETGYVAAWGDWDPASARLLRARCARGA